MATSATTLTAIQATIIPSPDESEQKAKALAEEAKITAELKKKQMKAKEAEVNAALWEREGEKLKREADEEEKELAEAKKKAINEEQAEKEATVVVSAEQSVKVNEIEHSSNQLAALQNNQDVEGVTIGGKKMWETFPTLVLYALLTVRETTFGPEIVNTALFRADALIRFGKCFNYPAIYFMNMRGIVCTLIIMLSALESFEVGGASLSEAYLVIMWSAAFFAFSYAIIVLAVFWICIYFPLQLCILPVAPVIKGSGAGSNDMIQLVEVTMTRELTLVRSELSQVFAAKLAQAKVFKVMKYSTSFDEKCLELFATEIMFCKFFVMQWLFMVAKRFSDIHEAMDVFDHGWVRFAGTLLIGAACWIGRWLIGAVVSSTWAWAWALLDRVFCFLPSILKRRAINRIKKEVMSRAQRLHQLGETVGAPEEAASV